MAWKKGQSGNPGGRRKDTAAVKELARKYTTEAIETLAAIMRNKREIARARVMAATALLDRGHGKPMQGHEIAGTDGGPLVVRIVKFGDDA